MAQAWDALSISPRVSCKAQLTGSALSCSPEADVAIPVSTRMIPPCLYMYPLTAPNRRGRMYLQTYPNLISECTQPSACQPCNPYSPDLGYPLYRLTFITHTVSTLRSPAVMPNSTITLTQAPHSPHHNTLLCMPGWSQVHITHLHAHPRPVPPTGHPFL